jgi:hypothetical protein
MSKNISEYKKRFETLVESDMGSVRPLVSENLVSENWKKLTDTTGYWKVLYDTISKSPIKPKWQVENNPEKSNYITFGNWVIYKNLLQNSGYPIVYNDKNNQKKYFKFTNNSYKGEPFSNISVTSKKTGKTSKLGDFMKGPKTKVDACNPKTSPKDTHPIVKDALTILYNDKGKYGPKYHEDFSKKLFNVLIKKNGNDLKKTWNQLNLFQWGDLPQSKNFRICYQTMVGTDTKNGWDKVRHFIFTGYLRLTGRTERGDGAIPSKVFTYGKEAWDEVESWFGYDPEGWSEADISADKAGEQFAINTYKKYKK